VPKDLMQFQSVLGLLLVLSWQQKLQLGMSQNTAIKPKQRKKRLSQGVGRKKKRSKAAMRELKKLGRESHA
jgi:hypothetical protein